MDKFLHKAVNWVVKNLTFFDPSSEIVGESIEIRLKAFIELVYMYSILPEDQFFQGHNKLIVEQFLSETISCNNLHHAALFSKSTLGAVSVLNEYAQDSNTTKILNSYVQHNLDRLH